MITTLALSPARVITVTGPQTAALLAGGVLLSFAAGARVNRAVTSHAEKKRAEEYFRIPYSEVLEAQHKAEKAAARHARGVKKAFDSKLLEELRVDAANAYEAALHARAFSHVTPVPEWKGRPNHTKFTSSFVDMEVPAAHVAPKESFFSRLSRSVKAAVKRTPKTVVVAPIVTINDAPSAASEKAVQDLRDLTAKIHDLGQSMAGSALLDDVDTYIDDPGEASEEDLECASGIEGNAMHLDPALAAFAAALDADPDSTGSEIVDEAVEAVGGVIDKATQMLADAVERSEAQGTPVTAPTAGEPLRTPMITAAARRAADRASGAPPKNRRPQKGTASI